VLVTVPLHDINFAVSQPIDIKSLQNRLLNVCYVPAPGPLRLHFFPAIDSTNEANKAGCMRHQAVYIT